MKITQGQNCGFLVFVVDQKKLKNSPAVLMPFVAERVFNWKQIKIDKTWGLNTIQNGQTYSICNTLLCSKCNFVFLDIRFSGKNFQIFTIIIEVSNILNSEKNTKRIMKKEIEIY